MKHLSLPIDSHLSEIGAAVAEHKNLILTAEPGTGKTTRIPPFLLDIIPGKIAVLQPRRLAAIAACSRIAEERAWTVGREVGYQVRFESKVSRDTRLVFMTDALMLRRWVDDPEMREFDLIIIDEFHERNLNQDVVLGGLRELQDMGSNHKIIVMSATLETQALLDFLPDSRWIDVAGKTFPLTIRHSTQPLSLQTDRDFIERVENAIRTVDRECDGDILVFLPGTGEIRRLSERLEGSMNRMVLPLHGSLSLSEQAKVLKSSGGQRRVILSTNVAEASVTVQGVNSVIDTGLARIMNMNLNSGFSSLELGRISLFNARQRAGRAARERPGDCWRLWTEHEEVTQVERLLPECCRTDLSSMLLLLAFTGVRDFASFAWLDRPPSRLLDMSIKSLRSLGALEPDHSLTEYGRQLLRFPLPPRLASLLLLSEQQVPEIGGLVARACAVVGERDFVISPMTTGLECDVSLRLTLLQEFESRQQPSGVQVASVRSVLDTAEQLSRLMSVRTGARMDFKSLRRLLLLTHMDRLCRRRGQSDRGLMVGGRGVKLAVETQVRTSEFFVALAGVDLAGQNETRVSLASGFSKAEVCDILSEHIEIREEVEFVESKAAFFMTRARSVLGLPIEESSLTPVDPGQVADRMKSYLVGRWDWLVEQNAVLGGWMKRWNFLVGLKEGLGDELSLDVVDRTVEMAVFDKTKVIEIVALDLLGFLKMNLSQESVRMVEAQAPERFRAPSGFDHVIQYGVHGPYVEIRLQELFGQKETPRLGFGMVPLTFHLLGPNYRPVQVTSDIGGFWTRAYHEVRKELRARYPKHSWPEDPIGAKPEAKGRRRS